MDCPSPYCSVQVGQLGYSGSCEAVDCLGVLFGLPYSRGGSPPCWLAPPPGLQLGANLLAGTLENVSNLGVDRSSGRGGSAVDAFLKRLLWLSERPDHDTEAPACLQSVGLSCYMRPEGTWQQLFGCLEAASSVALHDFFPNHIPVQRHPQQPMGYYAFVVGLPFLLNYPKVRPKKV